MSERWPFGDLEDTVAPGGATVAQVADMLGVTSRSVLRYRKTGITEDQADRLCGTAGVHPWTVWPAMADRHVEAVVRVCARDLCDTEFVPVGSRHRFCSTNCRKRHNDTVRRSTPEGAEKNRARRRDYYRRNATRERERELKAYWSNPEAARARMRRDWASGKRRRPPSPRFEPDIPMLVYGLIRSVLDATPEATNRTVEQHATELSELLAGRDLVDVMLGAAPVELQVAA